jgi:glyoxylase I family protein
MDTRGAVERYYKLANAGAWEAWCGLFAEDAVLDEQLAGRIRGRERLRELMAGFPALYPRFANLPRHVVVDGDQAAVFSHLSAHTAGGESIEAEVCNYFRFADGLIAYFANVHDTVPFAPAAAAPRWSHVGLNCADQDRTERYYTRWFGFRRVRADGEGAHRVLFLRNGTALLELFPAAGPPGQARRDGPAMPGAVRHLAFQVGDLDAFLAGLGDEAVPTHGPFGFDHLVPGWRAVWLADPDGVVVEVAQRYADQETR